MLDELLLRIPILGSKLIDYDDFFEMIIRFLINLSLCYVMTSDYFHRHDSVIY